MSKLLKLIKGELVRLYKYKILIVGIIVSLIWVLIIGLSQTESIKELIPMLIMLDAAMMNIIFLSASFFLEKQEGTMKTLLVTPIKLADVLIAKVIATIITSFISAAMVIIISYIVHNIIVNLLLLLIYLIIIVFAHTAIGFLITLFSREFTGMIAIYAGYAIVALLPSILFTTGILGEVWEYILIISPSHSAQILINSLFFDSNILTIILSLIYLTVLGLSLYLGVVYKRFKKYAIGG